MVIGNLVLFKPGSMDEVLTEIKNVDTYAVREQTLHVYVKDAAYPILIPNHAYSYAYLERK